jgi:hypothetical protein
MEEQHPTGIARVTGHNVVVVDMSRDGLLAVAVRPPVAVRQADATGVGDVEEGAGDG